MGKLGGHGVGENAPDGGPHPHPRGEGSVSLAVWAGGCGGALAGLRPEECRSGVPSRLRAQLPANCAHPTQSRGVEPTPPGVPVYQSPQE